VSDAGTVFVVDDDPSIRRSLGRLLSSAGLNVELFKGAQDLLERGRPDGPTCAVLDLAMPGVSGLEIQSRLRDNDAGMSIVFLTAWGDVRASVCAMKSGAVDFLTKPVDEAELLEAVHRALAADRVRTETRVRTATIGRRVKLLTDRERNVYDLVVTGLLNKQIAAELGIAIKTVKVHRARVMEKMSADSLAELARMAETVSSTHAVI
jgi:FixJ family two-component response regulator